MVRARTGPPPKFCSATCRAKAWKAAHPDRAAAQAKTGGERRKAPSVPCPYCDGLMRPHHNTCGAVGCRRADRRRAQREFQARYEAEHGERYRDRFDKCYKPGWRQRNPEAAARSDQARRARTLSAETELFDRRDVFERDRWRCQLCGTKVDRALAWPHPRSASLDHVVPLSKGGPHSKANAQLAHLECNLRKHNGGGPAQLALIG